MYNLNNVGYLIKLGSVIFHWHPMEKEFMATILATSVKTMYVRAPTFEELMEKLEDIYIKGAA